MKTKVLVVNSTEGCREAEVMMWDVGGHTLEDAINRRLNGSW